ncbi:MAG: RNA methyltransferase [Bacteroidales bacterium]
MNKLIGKQTIKYIGSLKDKKYRQISNCYVAEGEKIVLDSLKNNPDMVEQIFATSDWLVKNNGYIPSNIRTFEADMAEIKKISSFKTIPEVIALMRIEHHNPDPDELVRELSLVLDTVQDPGNLGNIIRIANWFGIRNLICSTDCADCYNPKVVQASMGAIIRVKVHYTNLEPFLKKMSEFSDYVIYGTLLDGDSIYDASLSKIGAIVLGNESKGISDLITPFIKKKIYIPSFEERADTVESLNVAAATAIVCAEFRRHAG